MVLTRHKLADSIKQRLMDEFLGDLGDASAKVGYLLEKMLLEEIDKFDIISVGPKATLPNG